MRLLLDTNVLAWICSVQAPEATDFARKFTSAVKRSPEDWPIGIPLVAAFETRRWLIWQARRPGLNPRVQPALRLALLENFMSFSSYVPHNSEDERLASELWVDARCRGNQGEHNLALGADALIAATARRIGATVLTTNIKDFVRYGYPAIFPEALAQQLPDQG